MDIPASYIPLKEALYGPNGLYPDVRMADAPRLFGRIVWRKGRGARFCRQYVKLEAVERVRHELREVAELIG